MDDVIVNKADSLQQCLKRIDDVYQGDSNGFKNSLDKQEIIILNIQRACELSIDMAQHVVFAKKLGLPKSAKDSFIILAENQLITENLCDVLCSMIGFRNLAVHQYQKVDLAIVESIIEKHLAQLVEFAGVLLKLA